MIRLFLASATIAALSGPLAALSSAPFRPDRPALVVLPPWASAEDVVARAGGRIIGLARAPLAVLVTGQGPGLEDRLRAAGAWTVLDGSSLSLLCGASFDA